MKRSIVVLSVLVAFFLTLTGAYAVENSTWGKVKASFVEGTKKATSDSQVVADSEAPRVAKKAPDSSPTTEDSSSTKKEKKDSKTTEEEDSTTYTKKEGPSRYGLAPR